ncbi:hypothetical protein WMY93_006202 [Mugilogobius chulae]|uniref:Uncharacterized protein n=1 Tax=Mugilogobius chulae TaxID=88201 RepID=A0AAW0PSU5_9GOBI
MFIKNTKRATSEMPAQSSSLVSVKDVILNKRNIFPKLQSSTLSPAAGAPGLKRMACLWWFALAVLVTATTIRTVDPQPRPRPPSPARPPPRPPSPARPPPPISLTQLSRVVNEIWENYEARNIGNTDRPMFSLIAIIPFDRNTQRFDVNSVITSDDPATVEQALRRCDVYRGPRLVEAAVLKYPDAKSQCPDQRVPWRYAFTCPNSVSVVHSGVLILFVLSCSVGDMSVRGLQIAAPGFADVQTAGPETAASSSTSAALELPLSDMDQDVGSAVHAPLP